MDYDEEKLVELSSRELAIEIESFTRTDDLPSLHAMVRVRHGPVSTILIIHRIICIKQSVAKVIKIISGTG